MKVQTETLGIEGNHTNHTFGLRPLPHPQH